MSDQKIEEIRARAEKAPNVPEWKSGMFYAEDVAYLLAKHDQLKAERLTAVTAALEAAAKYLRDAEESYRYTEGAVIRANTCRVMAEQIRSLSPQAILDQMGGE